MRTGKFAALVCTIVFLTAIQARGQFTGPSFYSQNPSTQSPGGIVGNTLVKTDTLTGFNIVGQVTVAVPPGPSAGILLTWEVMRPLDPAFPAQNMTNTASLTGFINAPIGNGAAGGGLLTEFTLTAGSTASAPINFAGPGITNFNVTNNTTFFYNPVVGNFMRQYFFVDYNYNGPGGQYVVDFPAESSTEPAPEPVSVGMLALGAVLLLRRR